MKAAAAMQHPHRATVAQLPRCIYEIQVSQVTSLNSTFLLYHLITVGGDYAPQHTSDLVRWPLLLKYGGVYAYVGMMQIGDLNRLWEATVGDPASRFEILTYNAGGVEERSLTNYFLCSARNNPLFARCHRLLLQLWAADGGKTSTEGMHSTPLLKGIPLMGVGASYTIQGEDKKIGPEEVSRMLTDYIIRRCWGRIPIPISTSQMITSRDNDSQNNPN